ncbi:hypothetical protein BGP75_05345 [Motiliproteus sp. MSK22-1]|nr:hypothetical protein BGP75_05345 [Motiliproteus sp. MSK22-1]
MLQYNLKRYDEAKIHLKNALKDNPEHLPSRLLIAQIYFKTGNIRAAEKEAQLAFTLGASPEKVQPLLGNILLSQRKYSELLTTIQAVNPRDSLASVIYNLRGRAYLELGQLENAMESFNFAALNSPADIEAILGISATLAAGGNLQEAKTKLAQAISLAPDNYAVWYESGNINEAMGSFTAALDNFNQAITLNPKSHKTQIARARVNLKLGNLDEALSGIEIAYENKPYDLNAGLILSQVLARRGDQERAVFILKSMHEQVGRIPPNVLMNEPLLLRAAIIIKYMSKELEQASVLATQYLTIQPDSPEIGKLLVTIKLAMGQTDKAIDILYSIIKSSPNDAEVYYLLGEALLRKKRFVQASNTLEQAAALMPDNPRINTSLGLSRFGMGYVDQGFENLTKAYQANSQKSIGAGVILTQVFLRKGEIKKAQNIANELIHKQPDNPILYNLLGATYLSSHQYGEARLSFEKASRVYPGFQGSEYNLALLDIYEKKYEEAGQRLKLLLNNHPESVLVLTALAELSLAQSNRKQAQEWLEKAARLKNASPKAISELIKLYLYFGQHKEALNQALHLKRKHPDSNLALFFLAKAQIRNNLIIDAKNNLSKATRQHEYPSDMLMEISKLQIEIGDYSGARFTLYNLSKTDHLLEARVAQIRLNILEENYDSALIKALELKATENDTAIADLLLGEISTSKEHFPEAYLSYKASFDQEPSSAAVIGMANAKYNLGDKASVINLLQLWLDQNPNDAKARRYLARTFLSMNQFENAQRHYETLLAQGRSDALVYSRLSRIYQLQNDHRALETAAKALEIAPKSSVALDSYGWILVTNGELQKGLEYLREASSRSSDPMIKYHLASTLIELGRQQEAIHELKQILHTNNKKPWMSKVETLLRELTQAKTQ